MKLFVLSFLFCLLFYVLSSTVDAKPLKAGRSVYPDILNVNVYQASDKVVLDDSPIPANSTGHIFENETPLKLEAIPDQDWDFYSWSDKEDNPKSSITNFALNSDTEVTAGGSRIIPLWVIPLIIIIDLTIIGFIGWLLFRKEIKVQRFLRKILPCKKRK